MTKKKVYIDKEKYEERLQVLKRIGVDPQKLMKYNEGFFNAILLRIKGIDGASSLNSNNIWWEEGNKSLREKTKGDDKKESTEEEIDRLKQDAETQERIAKLKKRSSKAKKQLGKFRKK